MDIHWYLIYKTTMSLHKSAKGKFISKSNSNRYSKVSEAMKKRHSKEKIIQEAGNPGTSHESVQECCQPDAVVVDHDYALRNEFYNIQDDMCDYEEIVTDESSDDDCWRNGRPVVDLGVITVCCMQLSSSSERYCGRDSEGTRWLSSRHVYEQCLWAQ